MMWGPYYTWQSGPWMGLWMLIPLVLVVALLIATLWVITRLMGARQGRQGGQMVARMTPEEVLRRRYASGEIDESDYLKMREQLAPTQPLAASAPKP
jgi:putative membrane protein